MAAKVVQFRFDFDAVQRKHHGLEVLRHTHVSVPSTHWRTCKHRDLDGRQSAPSRKARKLAITHVAHLQEDN